MNGFDIILIAMVAVFILLRLRAELGHKNGNEPLPPKTDKDPVDFHAYRESRVDDTVKKAPLDRALELDVRNDREEQIVPEPRFKAAFEALRLKDRHFDLGDFLDGAKAAYPMILKAFWQGDTAKLAPLLRADVFESFQAAIEARLKDGLTLDHRFIDLNAARIDDIVYESGDTEAQVTVAFEAEIIVVTKDAEGVLVEGSLSEAVQVRDFWTFSRDPRSKNPAWLLTATRSA